MRADTPSYILKTPTNLKEALALLNKEPRQWTPIAGGTDLMVLYEAGHLKVGSFLNLWNLKELSGIQIDDAFIDIGALTTFSQIQANPLLQKEFPNLCAAGYQTGGLAIQNRGTIGGNIINASPAADSPPALLSYDATIELVSTNGSRWLNYENFHSAYKKFDKKDDELIKTIRLPRTKVARNHYYRKVGTRKAQAISKVVIAAVATIENQKIKHVRISLGSVAPITLRCRKAETFLEGKDLNEINTEEIKKLVFEEISPIDDIRSTREFRKVVSGNLTEEFITQMKA